MHIPSTLCFTCAARSAVKKLFHHFASSHKSSYPTVFSQSEIGYLVDKYCWNNFLTALAARHSIAIHSNQIIEYIRLLISCPFITIYKTHANWGVNIIYNNNIHICYKLPFS